MVKKCMMNLPWQDPKFMNGISILKRAENPLKINALDNLKLHGI